ncbi:MAG: hypothetical protein KF770_22865 [Anaerolineae bacterium]|nr:hypothetical protein [Anaerolineae bacterium]
MSRKQKLRYLLAIYLVVALAAVVLGFIAFGQTNTAWQSLLLNLSTEFLGVVLLFLLVNVVFLIGDWDLTDQVAELVQKLKNPSARDFFKKAPSPEALQGYIQKAKCIDLCGVTLTATINRNFSDLRQRLFYGADVRIMIISPDLELLQSAAKRSESGSVEFYQNRLESTLREIEYLHKNWQDYNRTHKTKAGKLAIGLLPYTPSFGLLSFQSVSNDRVLIVEMYPHHKGYDAPPHFFLTPENDGVWFDYFSTQFEEMWKKTTPWSPETVVENS